MVAHIGKPSDELHLGGTLAQQAGYQAIVASDCVTALKFLRICQPELILLDELLLTRNGIDLLPRLQVMSGERTPGYSAPSTENRFPWEQVRGPSSFLMSFE